MALEKNTLKLKADGRIWIYTQQGKLAGKGRIELLEKIQQFGSIRQSAASMKMSYRQAWEIIEEINRFAREPVVISRRGGKGGGCAIVTKKGEKLIALFKSFDKKFQRLLEKESVRFIF